MKINLKKIYKAYQLMKSAEHTCSFVEKYRPNAAENARQELKEARAAFSTIAEPLTAAIKTAEGKATARTLSADGIVSCLIFIEDELSIPKKAMDGISIQADIFSQKFPSSYKYIPESTHFSAVYHAGVWYITAIWRGICRNSEHIIVTHTDASKAAIIERLTKF